MKQSNLLNAQFARRLFRTAFSSWQLLAVMLIVWYLLLYFDRM